jgi:transcription elongation GreA/GreB family factor
MTEPARELPAEVAELIDHKKFEELEDLWTRRVEAEPRDLPFFYAVASAVKKKGGSAQAVSWLRLLADYQAQLKDEEARVGVLAEALRLFPTEVEVLEDLVNALRARFAGHPMLAAVLAQNPLEKSKDPAAVVSKIRRWLAFQPGDVFFLPGRGAGRIVEMNPALDFIRLEFSGTRLPLSLLSAEKTLVPLPPDHFLREKLERPADAKALADNDPAQAVRKLLASFGRPLTVAEVKDHFSGLVPDSKWTAFWAAARKHKQLLVSGNGKSATVGWLESASAAEDSIRREFDEASPEKKIDVARRQGKRSKVLAREFSRGLAQEARKAASDRPALAWELSQAASKLTPEEPEAFPASDLLAAGNTLTLLSEIGDPSARSRALEAIRQGRADWLEMFSDQFLRDEDQRVLAGIFEQLPQESRDELARRIFRSPRMAPRAFVWLCETSRWTVGEGPAGLFFSLLDALRQEEFSGVRARVKEFFDPGGLAVALVQSSPSEEKAREMLEALNRAGGLEEHRRSTVREALLMTFPELRAPAREWIYGTAESIEAKRRELSHMKSVELPENARAMQAAKELGDLSENFEYHAARQRHEYLSSRIATLVDELSRARPLEPARVDPVEIRVGTRVRLRESSGAEREITILGPWDSKPEDSIYSYQSEFAQELLGRRAGERVEWKGAEIEIVSIGPWR